MKYLHSACLAAVICLPTVLQAQRLEPDKGRQFIEFLRGQADELLAQHREPTKLKEWSEQRAELRRRFLEAWGGFPKDACPLAPKKLGELTRDGYRIEKIIFQTRPGIWMTTNAYVPDKPGKLPAVLCVHGHWRGAKQDPVVQSRCIGLAKHGFFVLVVDAFGAGERAVGKALGEYHGEMTGATLLPVGLPLSGLQVYENMRAVDYLVSRPEVDAERIGITGASGGGNQSEYAGAWDERLKAVVPVCSVGTARASLQVPACMCEIVPSKLRFAGEWSVLAMSAPRGLLVLNATLDGIQFSVAESRKSLAVVAPIYQMHGQPARVRHAIFESKHDYNQEMREALYGWMTQQLKGVGDGSPIAEPEISTEDPEALRCFPGNSRPDDFVTIPRFAAVAAQRLLREKKSPNNLVDWKRQAKRARSVLGTTVFGGAPSESPLNVRSTRAADRKSRTLRFDPELGLTLTLHQELRDTTAPLAILLDLEGSEKAAAHPIAAELRREGCSLVTIELRATGRLAYDRDQIRRAPDHNTAEWSILLGRPLLGQWVLDVRRGLDALNQQDGQLPDEITIIGLGPAGVVALCSAAMDTRITRVATVQTLASYVSDVPYEGQRMGILAPGILRDVGDIPQLAALVAPRRVVLAGSVHGSGSALTAEQLQDSYRPARSIWQLFAADRELVVSSSTSASYVVQGLLHP